MLSIVPSTMPGYKNIEVNKIDMAPDLQNRVKY